jgi:hypothetical protein
VSNVFPRGTPFYPVPQSLIASGLLKNLSPGAEKLYQLLLFIAQKRTRIQFELSNLEIRREAGLSPNTIRRARTELKEVGLVDLKQTSGGRYTYVILDPATRSPLPRPMRQAKSPSTPPLSLPTTDAPSVAPSWSDIGK